MRMCVAQCFLALLGLAFVLCRSGASAQLDLEPDLQLDLGLRERRLLQRARALGITAQDWSKNELEDLLYQLTLPESELRETEISSLGAKQDLTVELERSAENSNSIPPRERKSECFFWKAFTSC